MAYPSVVRIFATTQEPDYDCPWQTETPSNSTGSGVIIDKGYILTGAHVVANATFLQVQKVSDPNKVVAEVEAICHEADLALLRVEDPQFTEGIEIPELGTLPELRDRVSVVGYPVGGEEISITEGVVSRIEVQRYSHSQRHLLAVTVDAAINSGNSGGPVFQDGKIAGIAFQKLTSAENIGELVPTPLLHRFLKSARERKSQREFYIPGLGIITQKLENPTLREDIGLASDESGVIVSAVTYGNSAWGYLRPGDALLRIGEYSIANNATIQYHQKYRTRYDVLLCEYDIGESITMTILREGKRMELELPLQPLVHLVPRSQYDLPPTYFVYAGFVFQTLTRDFLSTWKNWWDEGPKEFLHEYYSGLRKEERQELVVLSQILADEINVGYEDFYNESILSVNGVKPCNMKEFVQLVEKSGKIIKIQTSSNGLIVLKTQDVKAAQTRILERYRISRDRSHDLNSSTEPSPKDTTTNE